MKKFLALFFTVLVLPVALFAAEEKFFDCGEGYVVAAATKRDGIPAVECKKLWCRDLENGKSMGRESVAANGYELTSVPVNYDYYSPGIEEVSCFGKRRWCNESGQFNAECGMYTKGSDCTNLYRSVLKGNCYAWQLQEHNCGANEIAINNGMSWTCLTQGGGADGSRSAIKAKAIRRTVGAPTIKIRKMGGI